MDTNMGMKKCLQICPSSTILDWPEPVDKSKVKSFLQTTQFVATYMRLGSNHTYADVITPLRKLTNKNVKFYW